MRLSSLVSENIRRPTVVSPCPVQSDLLSGNKLARSQEYQTENSELSCRTKMHKKKLEHISDTAQSMLT